MVYSSLRSKRGLAERIDRQVTGRATPCTCSSTGSGGSYRDRRVELFERFGGPEVGALARRRFLEVQGHPDQGLARGLATARDTALPGSRAIRTWRAARSTGWKCCNASPNRAARATRSKCSRGG